MIHLDPMREDEFPAFREHLIVGYADDKVRAGDWLPEDAVQKSAHEVDADLPQGIATPDHLLYVLRAGGQPELVGWLWVKLDTSGARPSAFIYDIEILETHRRKGYARQALEALEVILREMGCDRINLHVFAFNHAARDLYDKLGFEPTGIKMVKRLD